MLCRPMRRALLVGMGLGLLKLAFPAYSQQKGKVSKIGFLQVGNRAASAHLYEAFREAMRELGYVEGRIVYEHRFGENRTDRLHEAAAELVRLKMDVIVTSTDQGIAAA